jgi:hypothetical protein
VRALNVPPSLFVSVALIPHSGEPTLGLRSPKLHVSPIGRKSRKSGQGAFKGID